MIPLSTRLRPTSLDDIIGQSHLTGENGPLRRAIEQSRLHSFILWGPPGTGKTTLAQAFAHNFGAHFMTLSAVMAGVSDIRKAVDAAKQFHAPTILFIDEIHRFNKAQQDALLPHVESGILTLIGATTENPSFALNNALLSRARVYVIKPLQADSIKQLLQRAVNHPEGVQCQIDESVFDMIAGHADGDARRALNWLEVATDLLAENETLSTEHIQQVVSHQPLRFDKHGDEFHDLISALHKSVRGSDPDAALYWLARMLVSGCDPMYLSRRIVRMSTEDIGNADPRALEITLNAWQTMERLGSPEGELALAQAVVYCAVAPKSNAVYKAFNQAMQEAERSGSLPVPMHLRNAPTKLMKDLGYSKNYRYAHDEPGAYVKGEQYFPDNYKPKIFYQPVERGLEIKIKEKLEALRNGT